MLKEMGFYKGINLGGWLSQCSYEEKHMDTFISDEDYAVIAGWGADHIRIPFDYNILENEDGEFSYPCMSEYKDSLYICYTSRRKNIRIHKYNFF